MNIFIKAFLALVMVSASPLWAHDHELTFDDYRYHASLWQSGWTTFFTGSIALQTFVINSDESTDAEKFDARVSLVTSGSGLASMFLNPMPGARPVWDLERDHTESAEAQQRIMNQARLAVQRRRSLKFRLLVLTEQMLAGAAIYSDGRPHDGIRRFALGSLISGAFIYSTPFSSSWSSSKYSWNWELWPSQIALRVRF